MSTPLYEISTANTEDLPLQKRSLQKLIESDNVAEDMGEDELRATAQLILDELEIDEGSPERQEKIAKWQEGERIAKQQKTRSGEMWSDVQYPLLIDACIKFNAHAMPVLLGNGGKLVKYKLIGREKKEIQQPQAPQSVGPTNPMNLFQVAGFNQPPQRDKNQIASDATQLMNWQFTSQMIEWIEETDALLMRLPGYGEMYRKLWYSKLRGRPCSKLLTPLTFVVPAGVSCLEYSPRLSEYLWLTPNEIKSYVRAGLFREFDYAVNHGASNDTEEPQEFVIQHRYIDLDEDGYKEPYKCVVHKESSTCCHISANFGLQDVYIGKKNRVAYITKREEYVKYVFIPSLDEKDLSTGYYDLLVPINRAVNKSVNNLIDAGTLANSNSGFIGKDLKIGRGDHQMKVGFFNAVNARGEDIRKGLVQMQYPGPNVVLFQLAQFLLAGGKELANTQNIAENAQQSRMPATTTLALIEQGAKVANAIYKRIYRSFTKEMKLLKRLNAEELEDDQYIKIIDAQVSAEDFKDPSMDFEPTADPDEITDLQRMAKAEFLMSMIANPVLNPRAVTQRILEAANIKNAEELIAAPQPPPPDPKLQVEVLKLDLEKNKLALQAAEMQIKNQEMQSKILKNRTAAIKDLADAEAAEAGQQLQQYDQHLRVVEMKHNAQEQMADRAQREQELALQQRQQHIDATQRQQELDAAAEAATATPGQSATGGGMVE